MGWGWVEEREERDEGAWGGDGWRKGRREMRVHGVGMGGGKGGER